MGDNSNLYNNAFYDEAMRRSTSAAFEIMPVVIKYLAPKSIVDFGCGRGIFLAEAQKVDDSIEICAIDGEYVDRKKLLIDEEKFDARNLEKKITLLKKYDLAMSFEVGEHISQENVNVFIENIVNSSDIVLFSAAIPGQGGIGHINEQWPSYWTSLFLKYGYKVSDCFRKLFWDNEKIPYWRRQNILLFVKETKYDEVMRVFNEARDVIDIVHPSNYLKEIENRSKVNKEIQSMSKELTEKNAETKIYKTVAHSCGDVVYSKIGRISFWDMAHGIRALEELSEGGILSKKIECFHLDSFELRCKKEEYLVWGAGFDGRRAMRLLKLLGKKVNAWCDSNLAGQTIDGIQVMMPEDMLANYQGEIILVGSGKYKVEIMEALVNKHPELKEYIYEYNEVYLRHLYRQECGKKEIVSYPPLWMEVSTISACMNKCIFCAYHGEDAKNNSNAYAPNLPYRLSFDNFKRIADMAKAGGVPELHLCATGEPFLNTEILKMIDYSIDLFGEVSLQTGFSKELFEKNNFLEELIKREKHISYIATDIMSAVEDVHNGIKKGHSLADLMEAMTFIGKNSSIKIKATLIITKKNYKDLKKVIDLFVERNVNLHLLVVNLLPYNYSEFTSFENVYVKEEHEITRELEELAAYAREKGVSVSIPKPAELESECNVFWLEFQLWPVNGCHTERRWENMIPHACTAVIRGEMNSIGYLFDYPTIMDAWNNENIVKIRRSLMDGKYPSEWCRYCKHCHGQESVYNH